MDDLLLGDTWARGIGRGDDVDALYHLAQSLPPRALFIAGRAGIAPVHMLLSDRDDATTARLLACVLAKGSVGVRANVRSDSSHTPLTHALHRGCVASARVLLACDDVDVCAMPLSGTTPLMLAARTGDVPTLDAVWRRLPVHSPAGPHAVSHHEGSTLLMFAVRSHSVAMVRRCLAWPGCDVNAADMRGQHALIRASRIGDKEVARVLVECGAALGWCDAEGKTAAEYVFPSRERAGWESDMRAAHRVFLATHLSPAHYAVV